MSNVVVAVRTRPLNEREVDLESRIVVKMRDKSTILFKTVDGVAVGETRDDSKEFKYDYSFWSVDSQDLHFITQEQVYNSLGKSVLEAAFQGYNACVFAYGQTGSGKTFTMMGSEHSPGLIPRICENLFARTAAGHLQKVSYLVEASYMEIYNERVHDLLQASIGTPHQHNLKVREHPKDGPYVEGLSKHLVSDYEAIHALMKKGNTQRATASTKMNDVSSRSHAIFTLVFTQATYSLDLPCETVSKIHLVDLAGSERVSTTGAVGVRLKEGGSINKSLASLGNVISALAEMSSLSSHPKKLHIPYRDSTLTWLLKDSLGGNSKTIMIATISPAEVCYGETLSTLRYASRAKNIVNKPVVNEDSNVRLIRELRAEIKRLKAIISSGNYEETRERAGSHLLAEHIHKREEQIAELTKSWAGKWNGMSQLLEDRNLELHTEGIKMTVATERPHFLALDDLSATGVVLYQLHEGETTVGSRECTSSRDIVLSADDIQPRHCVVHCTKGTVELNKQDGDCYINREEVADHRQLQHGDIVQFGLSTIFRFNNTSQAAEVEDMNRSSFLNLSTLSKESERERLEREFSERMDAFRRKSEQEKAALYEELELLKQQAYKNSKSFMVSGIDDTEGCLTVTESEAYHRMQSIGVDVINRVVVGREQEDVPSSHYDSDDEVLPKNGTSTPIDKTTHYVRHTELDNQRSRDDSFVNIFSEKEKALEPGLPDQSIVSVAVRHDDDEDSEQEVELSTNEVDFTGTTSEAPTLLINGASLPVDDSEKNDLKRKVGELEIELRKKDLELEDRKLRRRSHAFGEFDSPKGARSHLRRRTASMRSLSVALIIDIPEYYLRGTGLGSYHVFTVKIELSRDCWKVYKSYNQFCQLHESLKARYPELSSLTLPRSKWIGAKKPTFVEQRRKDLKVYLQSLLAICRNLPECPLYDPAGQRLSKRKLLRLDSFFNDGSSQI